jgi:DNA-binding response OmpR family regulator
MPSPKRHILVIYRDDAMRRVIVKGLQSEGFNVSTASDRRSMIEVLDSAEISAVVLDLTASWDAERMFKEHLRTLRVPVVMISSSLVSITDAEERHLQLLRKPFRMAELYKALNAAMEGGEFGQRRL